MARRVYISQGVFRVSLPGFNANTADADDLAFWEGQDSLRVLASGAVTITRGKVISIPYVGVIPLFYLWPADIGGTVVASRIDTDKIRIDDFDVGSGSLGYYAIYRTGVAE